MAKLDRIVNVQISLNTTAIKEQSFSDLLILGPHILSANRSLVITDADQLLDLGMSIADPIYLAAADVFSQIPTINRLFIGRMQVLTQTLTVAPAPVQGTVYTVNLQWRTGTGQIQTAVATYTAGVAPTPTTVAAGLVAAINATAYNATAANVAGVITLTGDVATDPFAFQIVAGSLSTPIATSTENAGVALAAIQAETDDWYGVALVSRVEATILQAADWVEANEKLLGVSLDASAVLDPGSTTDTMAKLQQGQYFRTHAWYHALAATEWLEAAIAAKAFTFYPGAETWANQRLAGITYDTLAEGSARAVFNKSGNTFEPFRNFAITQNGRVAAGEWIDVIRFRDWLAEQIKISVVSALINANGKVPYTDNGIQIIVAAMRKVLDLGVARGGIAPPEEDVINERTIPSYVINAPRSANIAFNDKANRILRDLNFTARLAGAIHTVEIKGSLTYEL